MRRPKLWFRYGVTRWVIITRTHAIKIPRLRWGMWGFCQGVLANRSEKDWSGWPGVNPQLHSFLGGVVAIYRRVQPVDLDVIPDTDDPWWQSISPGLVGYDPKVSNLGLLDDKLVWIDYASPWNGCPTHPLGCPSTR